MRDVLRRSPREQPATPRTSMQKQDGDIGAFVVKLMTSIQAHRTVSEAGPEVCSEAVCRLGALPARRPQLDCCCLQATEHLLAKPLQTCLDRGQAFFSQRPFSFCCQ